MACANCCITKLWSKDAWVRHQTSRITKHVWGVQPGCLEPGSGGPFACPAKMAGVMPSMQWLRSIGTSLQLPVALLLLLQYIASLAGSCAIGRGVKVRGCACCGVCHSYKAHCSVVVAAVAPGVVYWVWAGLGIQTGPAWPAHCASARQDGVGGVLGVGTGHRWRSCHAHSIGAWAVGCSRVKEAVLPVVTNLQAGSLGDCVLPRCSGCDQLSGVTDQGGAISRELLNPYTIHQVGSIVTLILVQ